MAKIAPQDASHAEFVSPGKSFSNLGNLPSRFVGAEIDCRTHGDGAHVVRFLHGAKHYLIEFVRQRQQLVMVDLHDKRNLMSRVPRDAAQHTEGRSDAVAATLDG